MRLLSAVWRRIQRFRLGGSEYARWRGVTVGRDCRILSHRFGSEPFLIEIGDRVTVSTNVMLLTHDGATWLLRDEKGRRYRAAKIRIGSDVFIGYGSIIMPGVHIGDRVIVGAGSVVTRSIPSGTVVAGNPARFVCTFDDYADRDYATDADMRGATPQERMRSIAEDAPRPMLRVPDGD